MPGINRFYKPSQSGYQSQFVPDQLPADLMLKGLASKQGKYDTMAATLNKFGEWDQRALQGRDTEYVEGKKKDLESFIDKSMTQDLGSQEFAREYQNFKKGFTQDEGLKKVGASVAIHDEYQKRVKDLKEGKGTDYDQAFVDNYTRNFSEYTKSTATGGQGFEGSTQLGDASILSGVDINAETEKYFDHLKADGRESLKRIAGGLSYKDGWVGVSGKKVDAQAARVFDEYYDSRAGEQLQARFDAENIPQGMTYNQFYNNLTPEQAQEYNAAKKAEVGKTLSSVGQGFVHNKSTTNMDVALNKKHGNDREDQQLNPQSPNFQVYGNTVAIKTPTFEESTEQFESNIIALNEHGKVKDKFTALKEGLTDGSLLTDKFRVDGVLKLDTETMKLLEGIPGAQDFIKGVQMSPATVKSLGEILDNKIEDHNFQIHSIKEQQTVIKQKSIDATAEYLGNQKFGEKELVLSEALDLGNSISDQDKLSIQAQIENGTFDIDLLRNRPTAEEQQLGVLIHNAGGFDNLTPDKQAEMTQKINTAKTNRENLMTWAEATHKYDKTMDYVAGAASVGMADDYEDIYNSQKAYQPKAQVINQEVDTYRQLQVNEYGQVVKTGNAFTADKQMQNLFNANSDAFTVYIGSERIKPGDPRYPDELTFGSANKETYEGKPTFNASKEVTIKDEFFDTEEKKTYNYTVVATNLDNVNDYYSAKGMEAQSNVLADANYDSSVSMYDQRNLSAAGRQSLLDYTTYQDPKLAEQMSRTEGLKATGEKTFFSRDAFNPHSGKVEKINYQVKKSGSSEGGLIVEITDNAGNFLTGDEPSINIDNAAQLSGTIYQLERSLDEAQGQYENGQIGLSKPGTKTAEYSKEGVYQGSTTLTEKPVTKDETPAFMKGLTSSYLYSSSN